MTGAQMIARERTRQRREEKWSAKHDNGHTKGELAAAAACYALPPSIREQKIMRYSLRLILWPWSEGWWKPKADDRIRELVKAGALIAAEIDRLQRAASYQDKKGEA